jgi:HTH-type transcriptional regulator/antitoxin HigA
MKGLKTIKSKPELQKALAEIERLLILDPDPVSEEGETLKILTLLIADYENGARHRLKPDPIEAILFRMEQQNLSPRDLVPFIGSRSKVSEVISRKRPLSLAMIRALHDGLGIPAESLLRDQLLPPSRDELVEWDRLPIREMARRGWLKSSSRSTNDNVEEAKKFFDKLKPISLMQVLYRTSRHTRSARKMDQYALAAWTARVITVASADVPTTRFVKDNIDRGFLNSLVRLSVFPDGPRLACRYLRDQGVSVVIERHLPGTYLDGSAIAVTRDHPIVALTLRYDRVDNFWFTLMHELAHLSLHLGSEVAQFYDDFDVDNQGDTREREADAFAGDILIPKDVWDGKTASRLRDPNVIQDLARRLGIHPAIVAGRVRYEAKDFRILNKLVGHNQVRPLFEEGH